MTVTIYFPGPPNLSAVPKENAAKGCVLTNGRQTRRYIDVEIQDVDTGRTSVDISPAIAADFLSQGFEPLAAQFRIRSCETCHSCMPIRVVLPLFNERSEHRRITKKNADLSIRIFRGLPSDPTEYEDIYRNYRIARFFHGSKRDYQSAKDSLNIAAYKLYPGMAPFHIDARLKDRASPHWLMGSLFFHTAGKVAYGSMFFYDMGRRETNLGHAMVLHLVRYLQARGFEYLYMGHWTRHPSSFSWKDQLMPVDIMENGEWVRHLSKATLRPLRYFSKDAYPAQRQAPA